MNTQSELLPVYNYEPREDGVLKNNKVFLLGLSQGLMPNIRPKERDEYLENLGAIITDLLSVGVEVKTLIPLDFSSDYVIKMEEEVTTHKVLNTIKHLHDSGNLEGYYILTPDYYQGSLKIRKEEGLVKELGYTFVTSGNFMYAKEVVDLGVKRYIKDDNALYTKTPYYFVYGGTALNAIPKELADGGFVPQTSSPTYLLKLTVQDDKVMFYTILESFDSGIESEDVDLSQPLNKPNILIEGAKKRTTSIHLITLLHTDNEQSMSYYHNILQQDSKKEYLLNKMKALYNTCKELNNLGVIKGIPDLTYVDLTDWEGK